MKIRPPKFFKSEFIGLQNVDNSVLYIFFTKIFYLIQPNNAFLQGSKQATYE